MTNLNANRISELIMSAGSACAVISAIALFDGQVRSHIGSIFRADSLTQLSSAVVYTHGLTRFVTETTTAYTNEHQSLVFFGIGGIVLVLAMLKT